MKIKYRITKMKRKIKLRNRSERRAKINKAENKKIRKLDFKKRFRKYNFQEIGVP